jgi:sulfide:quinone oxidoreductase
MSRVDRPQRVIVAGGGVAALELCLALRAFAGERVHITLIAPEPYFVHRPVDERDPLAVRRLTRVSVARVVRGAADDLRRDRLAAVDPAPRLVHTAVGHELAYDALVVAVGAVPQAVPAGAEPFDRAHTAGCRDVLRDLVRGELTSVAFVVPPAPTHAFDVYDLALEAAVAVRREDADATLTLVTAEPGPLALLGRRASATLHVTLGAHGLRVVDSAYVRSIGQGHMHLAPLSRRLAAERVIAAPRLAGPELAHLQCDADGFLPVDPLGRVTGVPGVFAAGDCTSFPVKHPSLTAQQADAVASTIAAEAGARVEAVPFEPVLRGMLPSRLRWYVEAPLTGGHGDATRVSALPLWSPPLRFHARFLGASLQREARWTSPGSVETTHSVRQSERMEPRSAALSVKPWPSGLARRPPPSHSSTASTSSRARTSRSPAAREPTSAS